MTHRCRKKLKKPALEFLMILNQLVPFLKKTWKKSWKNLKKSFVIILQPSQFSILFFQKSKIPLKLCWNTKNHGFNPTRSDCNWPWHLMKLCWSHGTTQPQQLIFEVYFWNTAQLLKHSCTAIHSTSQLFFRCTQLFRDKFWDKSKIPRLHIYFMFCWRRFQTLPMIRIIWNFVFVHKSSGIFDFWKKYLDSMSDWRIMTIRYFKTSKNQLF